MQRRGWLIAGWATATVLAVLLGLQGVKAISDSVTGERRPSLSQGSVRAALDRSSSSSADGASSADTASSASASSSVGAPSSSSGRSGDASDSSSASSGDDGPGPAIFPDPQSSSEDGGGGGEGSGGSDGSSSSAATVPPQDETYQLVGGTVTVRFENNAAHVLWASPAPGFDVEDHGGGSEVDIRFRSDDHESRLRAFWNNGPQHVIEEKDN